MAAPARVDLGANMLNRKWWIDVNTGTYGAPTWTPVNGHSDFKPVYSPDMQNDSDCDSSSGAKSTIASAYEWAIETKLMRKVTAASPTVYDPGQEAIRTAGNEVGLGNVVDIRFYEMNLNSAGTVTGPTTEAYRGFAAVEWSPDGGDMAALDSVSVKLAGRGDRSPITHPEAAGQDAVVYSVTPSGDAQAGGAAVLIRGANFFLAGVDDVASIAFGATDAPDFTTLNDGEIVCTVPAHAAGSINVSVTNSVGASDELVAFLYT